MKKTIYPLACLLAVLGWACSYEDHSTGADRPVAAIVIDTTGIPPSMTVNFGEELVIEPQVSVEDGSHDDFTYEWRLGLSASASTSTMTAEYKVAGTGKTLSYTMDLMPDALPYQLWYRVTDNRTRQMNSVLWLVSVEASSGQGLLVAHSPDGTTSDLSVIQDTLFTAAFRRSGEEADDPTLVKHALYSQANGARYDGIIRELSFQPRYYRKRLTNFVDGHSRDHCFRLNTLTFVQTDKDADLFLYMNPVIDMRRMMAGSYISYPSYGTTRVVWNNRGFQRMASTSSTMEPSEKRGYGIPSVGSWAAASAPGVVVGYDPDPVVSWGSSNFMFYDRLNGRFLYLSMSFLDGALVSECSQAGTAFDPRAVPGLEILAAGYGSNSDHRFVVKQDGAYKILTMLQSNGSARAVIDIGDAPEIGLATRFVICTNQPVVYYATSTNKVYSILFLDGLGQDVSFRHVYTSPEPIDNLELMRRGGSKAIVYPLTALVMTTSTGQTAGKVWILPMGTIGMGDLDTGKIVSFSGFNRISAVGMID